MTRHAQSKKRYAVDAHVLVGFGAIPGRVSYVASQPSTMGEYVHRVETERGEIEVLGCDLQLVPEAVTNVSPASGQANALRLLEVIYERAKVSDNPVDDVTQLNSGLTTEESRAAWRYLRDRGLIEAFNLDYAARINAKGIDAIEKAQSQPEHPISGFPSVTYNNVYNTVHVRSMVGSAVQQAGSHSRQEQDLSSVSAERRSDLEMFIRGFSAHLEELNLDARQQQRAKAQIATIQAQLVDPEPGSAIINQAGQTLRSITEGAIGSLIAAAVQPGFWRGIQHLMSTLF